MGGKYVDLENCKDFKETSYISEQSSFRVLLGPGAGKGLIEAVLPKLHCTMNPLTGQQINHVSLFRISGS